MAARGENKTGSRARGKKRGPKTKLTPEVEAGILKHLEVGAFLKHAAEAEGVSYEALNDWSRRADAGEKPYAAFMAKVRKVRARDAIRSQSVVTRAQLQRVDGDYRAAQWNLERKFPKEYGSAAAHAAVTVRTGVAASGGGEDDGTETRVQFVLPSNGRRPEEEGEP